MATINGTDLGETIDEGAASGSANQANTINAMAGDDLIVALQKMPYYIVVDGVRRAVNFHDTVNGGDGFDTYQATFSGGWTLNSAGFFDRYGGGLQWSGSFTGIERYRITAFGHGAATTGDADDVIDVRGAGSGTSSLSTGGGADQVLFGRGEATIDTGAGRDRLTLDFGFVNARTYLPGEFGGTFADGYSGRYYVAGAYSDVTFAGVEDFTITTSAQSDTVVTGDGDDVIATNAGNDVIAVGKGNDVVVGGGGIDTLSIDLSDEAQGVAIDLRLLEQQQSGGTGSVTGLEAFQGAVTGSAFADVLVETVVDSNAVIDAGAGDDLVQLSRGTDVVDGGSGRDRLVLDYSYVNARTYMTLARSGDFAAGYAGRYYIAGNYAQTDFSGIEDFTILSNAQSDTIVTGDGDDVVTSAGGDDTLTVGLGDDRLDAGAGVDALSIDLSDEATGVIIDLFRAGEQQAGGSGSIAGVESFAGVVIGSAFADVLIETAVARDARIATGRGDDLVQVSQGTDVVAMQAGSDRLVLDYRYVNARVTPTDAPTGSIGTGYAGEYHVAGNYARTTFSGVEHFTILTSAQNDVIVTGDGDDVVASAAGNDLLTVGRGRDDLDGGDGIDALSIDLSDERAGVRIDLSAAGAQQSGGTGAIMGAESFQGKVTGSAFADVLVETAVAFNAQFAAGAGDDLVQVSAGTDMIDGGDGIDRLVLDYSWINARAAMTVALTGRLASGYAGEYYVAGDYARSSFTGIEHFTIRTAAQNDVIVTGDGDDVIATGGGADVIAAGRGTNTIDGGDGVDGVGLDLSRQAGGVTIDLRIDGAQQTRGLGTVTGVESFAGAVIGTASDDVLIERAEDFAAQFALGAGNDLLQVSRGLDTVDGGAGSDRLVLDYSWVSARAYLDGALGGTAADGYAGRYYIAGAYADTRFAGIEHFTIRTSAQGDTIVTGAGDDDIATAGGNDVIDAGGGVNTIDGGDGVDALGIDLSGQVAGVTIDLRLADAQQTGGAGSVAGVESFAGAVIGSAFDDVLIERAEDFAAQFALGAGNDVVQVSRGLDTVDGGTGSDRLVLDFGWINARTYLDGELGGSARAGYSGRYYIAGGYADTRFSAIEHFTVRTSAQGDVIVVGAGDDDIATGAGDDTIRAGAGANIIDGGDGVDTLGIDLSAQRQAVRLDLSLDGAQQRGGTGSVTGVESFGGTVTGSRFADLLVERAVAADATIMAGAGNDTVQVSAGSDVIDGGAGNDRLILDYRWINARAAMTIALSTAEGGGYAGEYHLAGNYARTSFTGIEAFTIRTAGQNDAIVTGDGADEIDGGAGDDTIAAGAGADTLFGGDGADRLDGGAGADTMRGGAGNDTYVVENARDKAVELENEGVDTVEAALTYRLAAHFEALVLTGGDNLDGTGNDLANALTGNGGENRLDGRAGDDVLTGGDGNDTLVGGVGNDTMRGGSGDDSYSVDVAGDVVIEGAGGGFDTVQSAIDYVLTANVEKLVLGGAARIGTGNDGDNQILGSGGADTLGGAGGNDTIQGNAGNDTIDGGAGDDNLSGGAGRDLLTGGTGADRFTFRTGDTGADLATADRIADFTRAQGDRVVLAAIDADGTLEGDQAFAFIDTAAFSGVAGQLRYAFVGQDTLIEGDLDGDRVADVAIRLDGQVVLTAGDFVL